MNQKQRICPVCSTTALADDDYVCKACAWCWQTDMLQLAGLIPDLELVAAKQASPSPRNQGAKGNQGNAPLPISERPFDLLERIRRYGLSVYLLAGVRRCEDESTVSLITGLVNMDGFARVAGAAQLAVTGHELIGEAWRMFVPREPRTWAGECPSCGAQVYASLSAKVAYCDECGGLIDLTWLRAETLRRLSVSTKTFTAGELSRWLKSWGLKVSKRSIQRWAKDGQIIVGPEDADGRRTYQIGSILRKLNGK